MGRLLLVSLVLVVALPEMVGSASKPGIQRLIKQANWLVGQGRGVQGLQLLETRMCVSRARLTD